MTQPRKTTKPADEQADRIRANMREIDWTRASLDELEDMFEDRDPCEFL